MNIYNLAEAVIFGFREILNYRTMKRALSLGIGVIAFWAFVGYLVWDPLLGLTGSILDMLPFSMLRSNGAWMLSTFFWFALVLVSFSVIIALFGSSLLERVSKEKYSLYSLLILFANAVFWALVWVYDGGYIHDQFLRLLNWLPFETVQASLSYLMGLYVLYTAVIVSLLILSSFYSESLLREVNEHYFPYDPLEDEDILKVSKKRIKDIALYLGASVVAFPLLFVPVLNFVVQLVLWVWLIKDTFVNDAAALVLREEEREKLSEHKGAFFTISIITAFFNFVPLFNIFGPFFGEITLFYYLRSLQKEQAL